MKQNYQKSAIMNAEELILRLKKEFEFIKDDAQGILLYGSCAMNTANERVQDCEKSILRTIVSLKTWTSQC